MRLIDLAPTALDLVGVAAPPEFEGDDPSIPAAGPARATSAPAYLEAMDANLTRNWAPLTAVATRDYKLIDLPNAELYDLRSDPHETVNLFARDGERARTLEALLRGITASFQARGSSAEKTTLSADARQRLQALGYVASSADPGARVFTSADDPKTLIAVSNDLDRAVKAFNAGSRAEAMTAVRAIIRDHPSFSAAQGQLASMQRQSGDLAGAIATLEDMVRRGIADQRLMIVLADYLASSGALPKALALLDAIVAAHPDDADAHNSLGVVAMRMGRHDRARQAFRKVLELDPTSATAYANLGADALVRQRRAGGDRRPDPRARARAAAVHRALQPRAGAGQRRAAATRRGATWSASSPKRRRSSTPPTSRASRRCSPNKKGRVV